MTTKEIKLMIIENYIDHFTSDDKEAEWMKKGAETYVDEDWVDEITQAGYITNKDLIDEIAIKYFNKSQGGAKLSVDHFINAITEFNERKP